MGRRFDHKQRRRLFGILAGAALIGSMLGVYANRYAAGLASAVWVSAYARTTSDLAYGPFPQNRLDVLCPRWDGRADRPAVVVFHGGAWLHGSRAQMTGAVCRRYLERGFAVCNVDYRPGIVPAAEDARRALEWTYRHAPEYGIDRRRIVLTGDSAGGHLALLAAFTSGVPVAAVVDFYGVTDLTALLGEPFVRAALPAEDPLSVAERLSPLRLVRNGLCPVLAVHGTADPLVPSEQTTRLVGALRQAGNPAEAAWIEGGGHGFSAGQAEAAYRQVFSFLERKGLVVR
jgi:acetyl esterase/lipase